MVKPTPEYLALPWAKEIVETLVSGNNRTDVVMVPNPKNETVAELNKRLLAELDKEGFPMEQVDNFRRTADLKNCVVMSRAPGDATPRLIEHGHDLKGYQVKAKSCSWGPMAGFLCQLPCLNKDGSARIDYNDGNYAHYFEYIKKAQVSDLDFKKRVKNGFTPFVPLQLFNAKKLNVLENANGSILMQKTFPSTLSAKTEDQDVYGVAAHLLKKDDEKSGTVYIEFLLRRAVRSDDPTKMLSTADDEALWSVYHGRVLYLDTRGKTPKWSSFHDRLMSYMDGPSGREKIHEYNEKKKKGGIKARALLAQDKMKSNLVDPKLYISQDAPDATLDLLLLERLRSTGALTKDLEGKLGKHPGFLPLCVAQNPSPPYDPQPQYMKDDKTGIGETDENYAKYLLEVEKHRYKNAVTGDYDLFAVWPVQLGYGWQDLARTSDIQEKIKDVLKKIEIDKSKVKHKIAAFDTIRGKKLAVGLIGSPDVMIDVIPKFNEIGAWESEETGNINNASYEVAQVLNSLVFNHFLTVKHPEGRPAPKGEAHHFAYANHAFHSDEGGRPGIDEIDFPVGVFLPKTIASLTSVQRILNKNYKEGDGQLRAILFTKKDYAKFLALAVELRNKCYIPMNHIWITYLFGLVTESTPETGMFKGMDRERKSLKPEGLKEIRTLLAQLFLGGKYSVGRPGPQVSGRWGMHALARFPTEAEAANTAMEDIAKAFIAAQDKTLAKDKLKLIRAVKLTIPDRSKPLSGDANDLDVSAMPIHPSLAYGLETRK